MEICGFAPKSKLAFCLIPRHFYFHGPNGTHGYPRSFARSVRDIPMERRRQESSRQSTNKGARSSGISQPLVPGGTEADRGTPFALPLSSLSFEAGKAEALYGNSAFGSTTVAWAFCVGTGTSVGVQSSMLRKAATTTKTHTHIRTYTPIRLQWQMPREGRNCRRSLPWAGWASFLLLGSGNRPCNIRNLHGMESLSILLHVCLCTAVSQSFLADVATAPPPTLATTDTHGKCGQEKDGRVTPEDGEDGLTGWRAAPPSTHRHIA